VEKGASVKNVATVIPTYNYGRFCLMRSISALARTYRAIEIIVVDDGSTDDTPQVLAEYGESIRVIRRNNRGVVATRNRGIAAAKGDDPPRCQLSIINSFSSHA
jgi:glycosyltransferase involved in cell wall biosynthesis